MRVSICVIGLNEEEYLPLVLGDIERQTYPLDQIELILIDSMSTDATYEIMESYAQDDRFGRVIVLKNTKKTLPYGCNLMIDHFTGDVLIRIDAHARVPEDFIAKNVANIQAGDDVTGGARPAILKDWSPYQQLLLYAENSLFGSGIADYRNSTGKKKVKSIFHGMYRREVIEHVGHYDERLTRTEDNDYSYRIREAGYDIMYDDRIVSYQYARATLGKMMKQKMGNGEWTALTLFVQPKAVGLHHFVPFAFLMALILSLVLMPWVQWPFYALMISYFALNCLVSYLTIRRDDFHAIYLLLPLICFLLHVSYGYGTCVGLLRAPQFLKQYKQRSV